MKAKRQHVTFATTAEEDARKPVDTSNENCLGSSKVIIIRLCLDKRPENQLDAFLTRDPSGSKDVLLICGLPSLFGEKAVRYILSSCEECIREIDFGRFEKHTSAGSTSKGAHLCRVLLDEDSVSKFMDSEEDVIVLKAKDKRKWGPTSDYLQTFLETRKLHRPNHAALQREVDEYMKIFDENESESFYAAKAKSKTVDADGFIVVTRKGRTAAEAPVVDDLKESAAKKKQEKVLTSFYRFQRREARVAEMEKLRQKFEEDKARIAKLKESRKFKPY